jgi:predicted nuclease with TOPRIM domain
MADVADNVQKLLQRLEQKTEEIQAVRQRLSRLEFERSQIREAIKGYFLEDDKTRELEAQESQNELVFGRSIEGSVSLNTAPPHTADVIEHPDGAGALNEAVEAVKKLGGEVDARRLAEALTISFDAARLRLGRACRAGLIRRSSYGKYVPLTEIQQKEDKDIPF